MRHDLPVDHHRVVSRAFAARCEVAALPHRKRYPYSRGAAPSFVTQAVSLRSVAAGQADNLSAVATAQANSLRYAAIRLSFSQLTQPPYQPVKKIPAAGKNQPIGNHIMAASFRG